MFILFIQIKLNTWFVLFILYNVYVVYADIAKHIYIYIYTHIFTYIHIYIYIYVYVYIYIYAFMHILNVDTSMHIYEKQIYSCIRIF